MFETIGIGVLIILNILLLVVLSQTSRKVQPDNSLLLIQREVENLRVALYKDFESLKNELTFQLTDTTRAIQSTYQTVGDVKHKLGELSTATERIFEVGKDISSLQEILKAPKLRGGLSEFFLENLLSAVLPRENFVLQYEFKSGQKVDAIIMIGDRLVPVDAKFPLEDFRRMWQTSQEDATTRRQFIRTLKEKIDEIARKYILPDEGTYEFALMYIPAENVYYELISGDTELNEYAFQKRVIPVSPNTFYAYLQVIILGLKGLRIEAEAQRIMGLLGQLQGDLERFQEKFEKLGKNLRWAQDNYSEAERTLEQFDRRLSTIDQSYFLERRESEKFLPDKSSAQIRSDST